MGFGNDNKPANNGGASQVWKARFWTMGFKLPDIAERRQSAAKAKAAALEKFRAKAASPELAERLAARAPAPGKPASVSFRNERPARRRKRGSPGKKPRPAPSRKHARPPTAKSRGRPN